MDGLYRMLKITECYWDANNVEAISKHDVTPDEVEEAILGCDGESAVYLIRRDGDYYQVFGETGNGRLLAMVGEFVDGTVIRIFHAMNMTDRQRRAFRRG